MNASPAKSKTLPNLRAFKAPVWGLFFGLWLINTANAEILPSKNAIASAHPLATDAGFEIFAQGGNAFDAAVAVSAALAVVEPYGSGIGGGGFWLLHIAKENRQIMLDGREKAPLAATPDLFLDANGQPIAQASINGPLSAGIPGTPAGLAHLAQKYGQLPLSVSLKPAIRLAREGFALDEHYRRYATWRKDALLASPGAAQQFLHQGEVPALKHRLKQPDLAATLELIAQTNATGFYQGDFAKKLVAGVKRGGGIWSLQDLAQYQVIEREPIIAHYKKHKISSAALPSSGGIVLGEIFNLLANLPTESLDETDRIHFRIEAMRRAYQDRAKYLGDSDFVQVPVKKLLSHDYALNRASEIQRQLASKSTNLAEIHAQPEQEGRNTTHFSLIDRQGNRVAATLTINYPFGSGFVVPGTGVLLNDEMDDFSIKPGVPNVYGLVGNAQNAIEPGKRMLSSMSPTFIESDAGVAILGTPGGSRIISMVLLSALELIENGQTDPKHLVELGRYHHQYLPDKVFVEPDALSSTVIEKLQAKGHQIEQQQAHWGNMHAIWWDKKSGALKAASDSRGIGKALVR